MQFGCSMHVVTKAVNIITLVRYSCKEFTPLVTVVSVLKQSIFVNGTVPK